MPYRIAVLVLVLAACGDSVGPASQRGRFDYSDPAGDTVAYAGSDTTWPALDAAEVSGSTGQDTLRLAIRFATPIASGSSAHNSVVGLVEVDADADSATGIPALTGPFTSTPAIGIEYYIYIPASSGSGVDVEDIVTGHITRYDAAYSGSTVTMRIPLAAFGSPAGAMRMVALLGTPQRATDIVPNQGNLLLPSAASAAAREGVGERAPRQ